jgi:hypothetical protein
VSSSLEFWHLTEISELFWAEMRDEGAAIAKEMIANAAKK